LWDQKNFGKVSISIEWYGDEVKLMDSVWLEFPF
jgi:hypothetical protein